MHKKFKGGKTELKDEPRPSQPRKAATKANVAAVADMVKQDARITVKETADSVGVSSSGTVHKILIQELKLRKGPIVQNPVPNGKTITGKFYKNGVLSKVKTHYEKCRPATGLRGLCLIHDKAPAHKCVLVQDFLKEEKVVQLSHPPYSPDLSPCDFSCFLY